MTRPRYPIGPFAFPADPTKTDRDGSIAALEAAPDRLRAAVAGFGEARLDTPYRDGGWTLRQVVQHLPDSHLNSYVHLKWALTEDAPTVETYFEERWAELPDVRETP